MLGKTISKKYKITAQVGVGGMGCVYRAEHNVLGRQSALKVLHAQLNSDETFIARFMREARAMARLDHDNIVRIYDVFEEDGLHFIAMELFEGPSLKTVIENHGRLSLEQTVSIISQCARGLAYAHAQGIVHRDIKPSNIMLNAEGHIKITDFGIAAAMDDAATLTNTGQLVGTPRYMSPEQAKNGNIDRRSDFYSLGIVFYELVTGRSPFEGDSGVAIIGKLAYESSELDLDFDAKIPDDMRELIRKMLLRHQDERIQHATHLMGELSKLSTKSESIDSTIASSLSLVPIEEYKEQIPADRTSILPLESNSQQNILKASPYSNSIPNNAYSRDSDKIEENYRPVFTGQNNKKITIAAALILLSTSGGVYYFINNERSPEMSVATPNSEESTLAILVQKGLYQLLEKKTTVELEMVKATEVNAHRLSGDKFGSASDKFLIAEGALTAIERDIQAKNYQKAKISIARARNVFDSASLLFKQARQESEAAISGDIFAKAKKLKKQTFVAARKIRNEKFSGAFKSKKLKAARLTKHATRNYDKAKLQFDANNIDIAINILKDVQREYSEAETIYTNLSEFIQGQELIDTVYSLRSKLHKIQLRVLSSKNRAQKADAATLAQLLFSDASNLHIQLDEGAKEAKLLLREKDYRVARRQFSQLIELANSVAKKYTESMQLAQQQNQRLAPRKQLATGAPMHRPSQRDIFEVERMLRKFKDVYESRDIAQLQQIVDLSPMRLQAATAIFNQFNEIHLSVTSYSLVSGGGTANVRIDKVVTANGDNVIPSTKWRDGKLEFRQNTNGSGWGKIVWK